jgi:hypothetical protein
MRLDVEESLWKFTGEDGVFVVVLGRRRGNSLDRIASVTTSPEECIHDVEDLNSDPDGVRALVVEKMRLS